MYLPGDDEPIVTSTLAVRSISMTPSKPSAKKSNSTSSGTDTTGEEDEEEEESISLPVPAGMAEGDAPKVTWKFVIIIINKNF